MTVASEETRSGPYTGNGVTTVFDYEFRILDATHIKVIRSQGGVETVLSLGSDYSVSGVGASGGGQVTTSAAPTAAQTLIILRNAPLTQEVDLENQGPFFAQTIEDALDLAAMRDQQLSERLDRAVVLPASATVSDLDLLLADIILLADHTDEIGVVAGISADVEAVAAIADGIATVAEDKAAVAADRVAVEAVYDSFDDRYLGAKSTPPTTDNDGGALVAGALYFHTGGSKGMRVWDGTSWVVAYNPAAVDASTVTNTPSGGVTSTTVQGAINELDASLADKAPLASPALTGTPTAPTPASADVSTKIATTAFARAVLADLIGYISGLELDAPGGSGSFLVRPGIANDRNAGGLMRLATTINKTTSAWAVGDNNGGLDTGAIANNTWYHAHLIKRPDTGVVDGLFSLSATAPTLPANYTLSRHIGSLKTNASAQWVRMHQDGDEFYWDQPVTDLNGADPGAALYTISTPPGIATMAHLAFNWRSTGVSSQLLIHSPLTNNQTVNSPTGNVTAAVSVSGVDQFYSIDVMTNLSRQIRTSTSTSGAVIFTLVTKGWRWARGK